MGVCWTVKKTGSHKNALVVKNGGKSVPLTIDTLLANSADDILKYFLIFPRKQVLTFHLFMQIVSIGDNCRNLFFGEKNKKIFQNVCWKSDLECYALNVLYWHASLFFHFRCIFCRLYVTSFPLMSHDGNSSQSTLQGRLWENHSSLSSRFLPQFPWTPSESDVE